MQMNTFFRKKSERWPAVCRVLLFLLIMASQAAYGQNISVKSFKLVETDLTAQNPDTKRVDQNSGELCAVIRVQTTEKGFGFDVGSYGIEHIDENHVGEIWVYVPYGVLHMDIRHPKLGSLLGYEFPVKIVKGRTYVMELTTGKVETIVQETINKQWVVFNVSPANSRVVLNGETLPVDEEGHAERLIPFGRYDYQVTCADHNTAAGFIEVNDTERKHELNVRLRPKFGWIEVDDNEGSAGADVYIDNVKVGRIPFRSANLSSGRHQVELVKELYKNYKEEVFVGDSATVKVAPRLEPDFATTTLTVDADAEIFVEGERKGVRTWTGPLKRDSYNVEVRQKGHRSVSQVITVSGTGDQIIKLNAPVPVFGSLVITSQPSQAKVYVDGEEKGTTPLQLAKLPVGSHEVTIRRDGYQATQKTVEIKENAEATADFRLSTICRVQLVTSAAPGTEIFMDGKSIGKSPVTVEVPAGKHRMKATAEGFYSYDEEIDIDGLHPVVDLKLKKSSSDVHITSNHSGSLYIDGRYVDYLNSGGTIKSLRKGEHTFKVQRGRYEGETRCTVSADNENVYVRTKANFVRSAEFYMEGNLRTGGSTAIGGTMGFYAGNVNIEAAYLAGLKESAPVYWNKVTDYGIAEEGVYVHKPTFISAKAGYGIRVGNRLRFTPQVGAYIVLLKDKAIGDPTSYDDGETCPASGAEAVSGSVSLRTSLALAPALAISITPEYNFSMFKSDGYKVMSGVSDDIKKFGEGFSLKFGLSLFF